MVLTEGMMAGRCAVISDCGNAREYVQDGVDGFICDFPTGFEFAKTLENAWTRRTEWRKMGELAHRKISQLVSEICPSEELLSILIHYCPVIS